MRHLFVDSEYCSMGRWIILATTKKLNMHYYDDSALLELIDKTEKIGEVNRLTEDLKKTSKSYQAVRKTDDFQTVRSIFDEAIKKALLIGPSIVHERGNPQASSSKKNYFSVLIYNSSLEAKIPRTAYDEKYQGKEFSREQQHTLLKQEDQARKLYKNACFNQEVWGKKETYDLCLNTAYLTKEQCVEILVTLLTEKRVEKEEFAQIVVNKFGVVGD
ncbi:putative uncharacterized protein [Tetragenococcus halophilus subsp. halophilus]|uniref:Uncharacterized protein n=1 Tax=Tetragenococcus halophilus (strain DSM 20338 / JCM 20259 / NCIMB 9735 / NBRC 12172) TaxID=945021 RepID=A0AAN1VRR2_TETHN|nr:hypothetical protein TEH_20310 [Tetragenococcus halophilus NBRC 12172]GBD71732.1 putative uncharacterized protein [Tetragenococcus halophilus subsp. halophilus]GFK22489.1 hypothetical protein WJ7_19520 [Tetragenococcus halophilus]GBD81026.1 putative uncharacterized protein [Tetragenococcus halophilus subsp. halophilus]GBD83265.1 putative uncharacterized protein [Tetragenococcus halophilus subsp. halophilus]